jgi:hypothetical protein
MLEYKHVICNGPFYQLHSGLVESIIFEPGRADRRTKIHRVPFGCKLYAI